MVVHQQQQQQQLKALRCLGKGSNMSLKLSRYVENFPDRFKCGKLKYTMKIETLEGLIMSEMTTEILEQNLTKIVLVRLKGGKSLRGRLKGFDQHLNLVLEETEDTSNPENMKKLGLIIVRGDNVVLISPPPR